MMYEADVDMTQEPDSDVGEYALRAHIRQLLLSYAVEHTATDYIQLTEQAVSDLWSQYLVEIPTADPHSLRLPTDPFDTLTRIHGLDSLEPVREKFQSTPSAVQYIKKLRLIKPQSGKLKSDRVVFEESIFESHVPVCRPMSPILTTRAIRETPRPGSHSFLKSLPASHREFLAAQGVKPIVVEPVLEPSVNQDDVLDTNWRVCAEARSLLQSALARSRGRKNRYLDQSARPDSPPLYSRVPDAPFIPIFPRRRRAGSGVREGDPPPSGLRGIASLPAVILPQVKVEEPETDLHEQNMVIVDGWHAYRSSPSPTPSPASSQDDQIDELFMSSPNTTPPPVRPTKMDVVQIPRTKRLGGERKKPLPVGHGKDLGSFLAPLVPRLPDPEPTTRLSPEPATSMLGQADSTCVSQTEFDREDVDDVLVGFYRHQRQDPRDIILREKVDEKRQLLMQVPDLPPPTEHPPNALFLALSLKDFVAPLKVKGQANAKILTHKFLKKAKGIPSLNVELSWLPIAAKTRIPSNVEILKVTAFLDIDAPTDLPTQIATLLETIPATVTASQIETQDTWSRRYANLLNATSNDLDCGILRCEIVLSRRERRRAAGLADGEEEPEMEDDGYTMDTEDALTDTRSVKRPRLAEDDYFDDSGVAFNDTLDLQHGSPTFYGDTGPNPFDDVDKENLPPFHAGYDDYYEDLEPEQSIVSAFPADSRTDRHEPNMYEQREFEALSFDSQQAASAQPTQIPLDATASDDTYAGMFEPHPNAIINDSVVTSTPSAMPIAPDIASRSLGIAEFARLRAKKVSVPLLEPHPISAPPEPAFPEGPSHSIPENIYDRNTLRLPSVWNLPVTPHRYMVSMELVQKLALLRSLRSRPCSVDLVERDTLGGVDIVLEPHTAIIFTNLLVLPSECSDLTSRIAQQSWSYSHLLIIFEAYPASRSFQSKANSSAASELFAYTPPILKALSKLRRDLGISDGCGSKRQACNVQYAFADTVDEAAMFTRHFGDLTEANDESGGTIWGDRDWLEDDIPEGEQDLAAADGMNRFASFVILCQIDLVEFLELSPEARVEKFGPFVGLERMILLNQVIERRLQALEPSESEMEVDPY